MDGNGFSDPYVKLFLLPGNRIVSCYNHSNECLDYSHVNI